MLDKRKTFVLKTIIQDYIAEAAPVGSNRLVETHKLTASSATIRNYMAELENEGYLTQPHHSAGRIPTDKGYRFYVNTLMSEEEHISPAEKRHIQKECDHRFSEIENFLLIVGKILSHISGCAAIVQTPSSNQSTVKRIDLILVDKSKLLLIIMTNTSSIINRVIEFPFPLTQKELERTTNLLNIKLRGIPLEHINSNILLADWTFELHQDLFLKTLELLAKTFKEESNGRLLIDGVSNLLEQPECNDLTRIKPVLQLLEGTDKLSKIINSQPYHQKTCVRIGHENRVKELKEFSIITSPYYVDDAPLGSIGILGPTRMHYQKLIPLVEFIAEQVSNKIHNMR